LFNRSKKRRNERNYFGIFVGLFYRYVDELVQEKQIAEAFRPVGRMNAPVTSGPNIFA